MMSEREFSLLLAKPLPDGARGFLSLVRAQGGRVQLLPESKLLVLAKACSKAGYAHLREDGRTVLLTGLGQAYLDRIARVE
ncbi:MAG: hypothetical protein BGO05_26205 [Rhizobiales bacterium 63-7]|nr:hypothetical protein [Hyphomicrobiales bacterium]OJU67007.1 MAG: hypothetical protein BGO05_26205 [Rhizobiales bacterium 63-7]